jgi:hypothetical protein
VLYASQPDTQSAGAIPDIWSGSGGMLAGGRGREWHKVSRMRRNSKAAPPARTGKEFRADQELVQRPLT